MARLILSENTMAQLLHSDPAFSAEKRGDPVRGRPFYQKE